MYFAGAFLLSAWLLFFIVRAALRRSQASVHRLFFASVIYLPLLLGILSLDKVWRAPAPTPLSALAHFRAVPPFVLIDQQGHNLAFVSFSVDPARDTSEALAAYARRYGADVRWTLLTGAHEAIRPLCVQGFRLAFDDQPEVAQEPILHSVRLVLVDRTGQIRGYYDATDAEALSRLREDARRLLGDNG
jgi:hypothetical protein